MKPPKSKYIIYTRTHINTLHVLEGEAEEDDGEGDGKNFNDEHQNI